MNKHNIFENIPKPSKEEFVQTILTNTTLKIQRIVSNGHISPKEGWYKAKTDEWVILLEGEATLSFKNANDVQLIVGDFLNIEANSEHKVSWTKENCNTVWLVVHY